MSTKRFIKPFNIRVSPAMAEEILAVADKEETTPSELFRRAAREHLERRRLAETTPAPSKP